MKKLKDNCAKQHVVPDKKTARQRVAMLLDRDSFHETGRLVRSPFLENSFQTDGVITGFGTVDGSQVAVYAQDFSLKGGSLGKMHAEKICNIMDLAAKIGCPIIGMIDSGGARIDEGIHALAGYANIFKRNVRYSGVVPQISLILGPCAGGASYSPALTDFIFMVKGLSNMFITGPQVIEHVLSQTITKEGLGGADVHNRKSGVAHVMCASEEEVFAQTKALLSLLPPNYREESHPTSFARKHSNGSLFDGLLPKHAHQSYDVRLIIDEIVDDGGFFEIQALFAPNIVVGFARLGGRSVGIVANQPMHMAGTIDIDASTKAARFVNFCDSFGLPVVTLVDVPGFLPGVDQEHGGIIRHGAKLLYAYANATVPKITLIMRKAFGGAFIVMGSKDLGADFNFSWPDAQIAVLGAKAAVTILHRKKLAACHSAGDRKKLQQEFEAAYAQKYLNPSIAAQYGYIDAIIEPYKTREQLIKALEITFYKVQGRQRKKHANIPL